MNLDTCKYPNFKKNPTYHQRPYYMVSATPNAHWELTCPCATLKQLHLRSNQRGLWAEVSDVRPYPGSRGPLSLRLVLYRFDFMQ